MALIVYAFFVANSKSIYGTLFFTPDSKTYLQVAQWILNGQKTGSLAVRPIFYPSIIAFCKWLFGHYDHYGIWLIQIIFYLGGINLAFISAYKLSKRIIVSYVTYFILLTNLSLMRYTMDALTEITTFFLLSILLYFSIVQMQRKDWLKLAMGNIFILSLLTITKPVFYIPLLVFGVVTLLMFRKSIVKLPNLIYFFIALLPVIAQIWIMKKEFDTYKISRIGRITFTNYIFAQGLEKIKNLSREQAIEQASKFSEKDKIYFVSKNYRTYISLYLNNLVKNIAAEQGFRKKTKISYLFPVYMHFVNRLYLAFHVVFIFVFLFVQVYFFKKSRYLFYLSLGFYALNVYYLAVTGISFGEGDRLVLPAIAIWSVFYPFWAYVLLSWKKESKDLFAQNYVQEF